MRTPFYRRSMLPALGASVITTLGACNTADRQPRQPLGALDFRTIQRASLRTIAMDTLSDSSRILAVVPEPDGDAVAFRFADPAHGIAAGLGLLDRAHPLPQLGWPDSVAQVRWRRPHELVFTAGTGEGVRMILDAHADTITAVEAAPGVKDSVAMVLPAPTQAPSDLRTRAIAFIDSVRFQPDGRPQQSALHYAPSRIVLAPRDSVAAFHVTAIDSSGRHSNPAWYILDVPSGAIEPIDSIVGPTAAMPAESGAWTDEGTFLFTKGLILYEVRVRRREP